MNDDVDTKKTKSLAEKVEKISTRKRSYTLDLRVHSPASLGYFNLEGLDTAPALVRLAKVKGLDVIAITDFYSGAFVDEVKVAASGTALTVIPGFGIRCIVGDCDDIPLTCLFPEECSSEKIIEILKALEVPSLAKGQENYILTKPLHEVIATVEAFGGIIIPSRIDKTPQRMHVIPRLVEEYGFRTFDLAYADTAAFFKKHWPKTKFQLYSFSSAKALAQIGSRTAKIKLPTPGFVGIKELAARLNPDISET